MTPKNIPSSPLPDNCTIVSNGLDIGTHIDSICAIEMSSFDPPWTKSDFINELGGDDSPSMILLNGKILIGYLFSKKVVDEITINKLCIHPEYRGKGYGKLLVSNFIARMKGQYSRMFLEVAGANTPALRLYQDHGFRVNRIRKAIGSDGGDALEMVLD